jgi:hypothetical protein
LANWGKKLVRAHLIQKAGDGGSHLPSQLHGRYKEKRKIMNHVGQGKNKNKNKKTQ